jgi:hypothetical protein
VLRAVEHDRKPDRALCVDAGVFDLTGCGLLRELDDAAYPGVLPRRATRCSTSPSAPPLILAERDDLGGITLRLAHGLALDFSLGL